MSNAPATAGGAQNKDLMYVLFALAWGYLLTVVWFIIQKLIAPGMIRSGNQSSLYKMYDIIGWTDDVLSIILMLVLAILVKNQTAKIFLIVFMVIHIITMIGYRVLKQGF